LHRDLKPQNILLSDCPSAVLKHGSCCSCVKMVAREIYGNMPGKIGTSEWRSTCYFMLLQDNEAPSELRSLSIPSSGFDCGCPVSSRWNMLHAPRDAYIKITSGRVKTIQHGAQHSQHL
jgi:serine/threonine protein kinase